MNPGEPPHQIPAKRTVNVYKRVLDTMCIILRTGSEQANKGVVWFSGSELDFWSGLIVDIL